MHPLAAEDGGGHGPQSVAAQVQLLQLLQTCQFTAGGGEARLYQSAGTANFISGSRIYQTYLSCGLSLILKRGSDFRPDDNSLCV